MVNCINNDNLKARFVNDNKLPINIFEEKYFTYFLSILEEEYQALSKWNNLVTQIHDNFENNPNKWLEWYYGVREKIITTIERMPEFADGFNKISMDGYKAYNPDGVSDSNVYNGENDGKMFLSIDLTKANFQAMRYIDPKLVFYHDTYSDFIGEFTDDKYFKESKYIRQVVFGKLNPKRQVAIAKYLITQLLKCSDIHDNIVNEYGGKLISLKSDELVYHIKEMPSQWRLDRYRSLAKEIFNIEVHCEAYKLNMMQFKTSRDIFVKVFEKEHVGGKRELKSLSQAYFFQVYKMWKGLDINEYDLLFYYEGNIAKFLEPLKLVEK